MKFLCDTHTFLWWIFDDARLSTRAFALLQSSDNELFLSAASGWEISTKYRLGKLPDARTLLLDLNGWISQARFTPLAITMPHAEKAGSWVSPHRDPFDRMIAAQSALEQLPVIGCDRSLETFGIDLVW